MGRTEDSLDDDLPNEVGKEALSKRSSLSGGSRVAVGRKWLLLLLLLLLNLNNLLMILIVGAPDRDGALARIL